VLIALGFLAAAYFSYIDQNTGPEVMAKGDRSVVTSSTHDDSIRSDRHAGLGDAARQYYPESRDAEVDGGEDESVGQRRLSL
jgi:hypothetical protein